MFRRQPSREVRSARAPRVSRSSTRALIPVATAACTLAFAALTPARAADLKWHGIADLVAAEASDAFDYNTLTRKDNPFDPFHLRVFAESRLDDRLQVLAQFVFNDASATYVDGAYIQYTPMPSQDLHLQAGKLPWAIGTYAPRTYSNKNPLISAPLMYQYHSSLVWYDVPQNTDALLSGAGTGQLGVTYGTDYYGIGMPIVDDSYWDVGVTLLGALRPLEFAVGMTAGAPSWGSTSRDDNSGKSVVGRIGYTPIPAVRVGVSGAYGPYLLDDLNPEMPAGHDVNDYAQKLIMGDAELLLGRFELRSEGAFNVWETPTVGDLEVTSWYAEGKLSFDSGLFVAARWDAQRYGEIADSTGAMRTWDLNVTRLEGGIGYRITREAAMKVTYQHTDLAESLTSPRRRLGIVAAQLSVGF